jgi:hypothetical protein
MHPLRIVNEDSAIDNPTRKFTSIMQKANNWTLSQHVHFLSACKYYGNLSKGTRTQHTAMAIALSAKAGLHTKISDPAQDFVISRNPSHLTGDSMGNS